MIDSFGRPITYLRVSVTDRCNLRCFYCMTDDPEFLPRRDILDIEELERLCRVFVRLGVRKIRITGGEPLVRRGIMDLLRPLGQEIAAGRLRELCLTTNGMQLARFAPALAATGVRRINVSLDSLDADVFRRITRGGDLATVLHGVSAARDAGLAVKINAVALRGVNDGGLGDLVAWCGEQGFDLTLIETMPLGGLAASRAMQYLPLDEVRRHLARNWTLVPSDYRTDGPARYWDIRETGCRLGCIEAMSHCFCASCNRVRLTAAGSLNLCLGRSDSVDLRTLLRTHDSDAHLERAILAAVAAKPEGHDFAIGAGIPPVSFRRMYQTGG
jgi:GTP 3',8-cyclase